MTTEATAVTATGDDLATLERLDLLRWAAANERLTYLAILQVFDEAKARYEVQLRPPQVGAAVAAITGFEPEADVLGRSLDALSQWGVLERSYDSARVASIEEYRRRRPVFQFTELGERAYRAVRGLLDAQPGDGRLQRLALREIAELLPALARALHLADGPAAVAALDRIDLVLAQLADRAGQFYVLVGAMTQNVEVNAERFLEMKELLLGHLTEFLHDLHRWTPIIVNRIGDVAHLGVASMIDLLALSDEAVFQSTAQRRAAWQNRWDGLVAWFSTSDGVRPSHVAQLDRRTLAAVRELTALLRRLLEARGRGASRAADLIGLAKWFWALDGDRRDAAHALFDVTFGLGGSRHLGVGYDDAELIAPSTSWLDAGPVEVAVSLRERARLPSPGQSAAIPDDRRAREYYRDLARQRIAADDAAAARLVDNPFVGRRLARAEFEVLLRLTDLALAAGVPVAGTVAYGTSGRVRVEIRSADADAVVEVEDGTFVLHNVALELAYS